jgi:hypothetical protein
LFLGTHTILLVPLQKHGEITKLTIPERRTIRQSETKLLFVSQSGVEKTPGDVSSETGWRGKYFRVLLRIICCLSRSGTRTSTFILNRATDSKKKAIFLEKYRRIRWLF